MKPYLLARGAEMPPIGNIPPDKVAPGQGLNLLADDLLRRLFPTSEELPSAVKRRLEMMREELRQPMHHGRDVQRASKLEYDRWIENMFRAVVDGTRRETLVAEFLEELNRLIHSEKSDALFALAIEENVADDAANLKSLRGLKLIASCGIPHEDHIARFGQRLVQESSRSSSHFWSGLFSEAEGKELIFSRYWEDYAGELDDLVNASHKALGLRNIGFWFSSVSLLSTEPHQPRRVLLVAYRSLGQYDVPRPAEGATMEWRVLFFLYIAYRTADHGVQNMHKEVAAQRESLIKTLAPGILTHELASQLRALHNNSVLMAEALRLGLGHAKSYPNVLAEQVDLGHHLLRLTEHCNQLLRSASAFLNLERAHGVEEFVLNDAVQEALTLAHSRLARIAEVRTEALKSVVLLSDRPLLVVVILNILANAAKAIGGIAEAGATEPRHSVLILSEPSTPPKGTLGKLAKGAWLRLIIANDGPPISDEWRGLIFLRGRTSDPQGFGQGLYLCRRICRYLGGDISLAENAQQFGASMQVAFVVEIPLNQPDEPSGQHARRATQRLGSQL